MLPIERRSRMTGQTRRLLLVEEVTRRSRTRPGKFHPEAKHKKCKVSGKVRWVTEVDALMAIANRQIGQGTNTLRTAKTKREVRAYQCPDCEDWHTTHMKEYHPHG